jgi:type VI secretion system protein ImpF
MAELSLRERLQPALFDRLIDDERLLTIYELTVDREALTRLGITARDLSDIVCAQGLERLDAEDASREMARKSTRDASRELAAGAPSVARTAREAPPMARTEDTPSLRVLFQAPNGRVGLARLKALTLKPPSAPEGVTLQSFCRIEARNVLNASSEPAEKRYLSSRRLRECVCRDLAILLNSTSLDATTDLSSLPHVQSSVLNYGMPSLAGRASALVDLRQIARTVEAVIRQFEPRLVQVRVTPEPNRDAGEEHEIALRIEAELWGQPVPQHLVLRTRISTESGDVHVADAGAA